MTRKSSGGTFGSTLVHPTATEIVAADIGPFGSAALAYFDAGLVVFPCGGTDGKTPLVKAWQRRKSRTTIEKWARRFPMENIGIVPEHSNLTVIDIDDPKLIDDALARFGDTPMRVRTPRGTVHLYYRSNGERTQNQFDGLAIDVRGKGTGFVVAPPSVRPDNGKGWVFESGSLSDLADPERLPGIKAGALPTRGPTRFGPVQEGNRNNSLFRQALREAWHCDDLETLIDALHVHNEGFKPPLTAKEVLKVATSAWGYHLPGNNWVGGPARAVTTADEVDAYSDAPDAFYLLQRLRIAHSARTEPFALAIAYADTLGWSPYIFRKARKVLEDRGAIRRIHTGGNCPGDPNLYILTGMRIVDADPGANG
jgi:hypothetical protein